MAKNNLDEDAIPLIWSPIHDAIEQRIQLGDKLLLIISPFIKHGALDRLLVTDSFDEETKVIVRWQPFDILNAVSDLSIYHLLEARGVSLYRHEHIHLKLYVFDSNIAFHSSGNLTDRGLGYSKPGNVEIGCFIELNNEDWSSIYTLIGHSLLVNDAIYEQFVEFARNHKLPLAGSATLDLKIPGTEPFLTSSLPAVKTPQDLLAWSIAGVDRTDPEAVRRFIHDVQLYNIPTSLEESRLEDYLRQSFISQPFVMDIVAHIEEEGSVHFGGINNWIHAHCADVPLPYRWEIKETTNTLYNWLNYFIEEISWDIPGKHSQVIYWNKGSDTN